MNSFSTSASRGVAGAAACLLILLAGCGGDSARAGESTGEEGSAASVDGSWNPQALKAVKGVPASAIRGGIQQRLGATRPAPLDEDQWRHVQRLYERYRQGPLWLTKNGLAEDRAEALLKALIDAHTDALRVDAYPLNELARALVAVKETPRPTAQQLATADVLLTAAYAALGEDLLTGQLDPRTVSEGWHIDPQEEQVDSALARALREEPLDRSIARMRPQDEDYAALVRELQRYRKLAVQGGWPAVPKGKALRPGQTDSSVRLAALRQRLEAEELLGASTPAAQQTGADSTPAGARARAGGSVYDAQLAGAVADYQARHGIEADSVLGEETVASLNTPAAYRLGQIAANLERFRWLPRSLGSRYVLVNVPAFRLEAYDGGRKALEMKVIVGEEYTDRITPVFSDSVEFVVFRPYWNVTDDIATKELWPKIQADPGYMAQNNYETFREGGKTRIRQKPGPENSLGLVKFMFPNDFNIYLHDTPQDELFEEDVRAFSHGCIRLEKPEQLAQWVLGWPAERVRQAMEQGPDDKRVDVPRKLPVYIAYFTTYLRGGQLSFGNDLYKRDDALIRAVQDGALPSAQTLRAVDSLRRFVAE
ncbi:MAG TPA: L,D-transpeptidase family protein [Longimicrobiaceae bacterium]|nr:L,D-transpeptidase family protein [Longimicrobiaceae bacterium]